MLKTWIDVHTRSSSGPRTLASHSDQMVSLNDGNISGLLADRE